MHEASLINEDLGQDDMMHVVETDRSAVKVSMIKKNNEIIFQDNLLLKEEKRKTEMEKVRATYKRHIKQKRTRADTMYQGIRLGESSNFAMTPYKTD